jgi:hypothetical protein
MTEIHGFADPRFAAVRDAFAANFACGQDLGASVAVTPGGEMVVDLWGGHAGAISDDRSPEGFCCFLVRKDLVRRCNPDQPTDTSPQAIISFGKNSKLF